MQLLTVTENTSAMYYGTAKMCHKLDFCKYRHPTGIPKAKPALRRLLPILQADLAKSYKVQFARHLIPRKEWNKRRGKPKQMLSKVTSQQAEVGSCSCCFHMSLICPISGLKEEDVSA